MDFSIERKQEIMEKINKMDDLTKDMIYHRIKYRELQNNYNNNLCTKEFKEFIEKLVSIDNFDVSWINYDIQLNEEEEENVYLTTNDINVNEVVDSIRNMECNMVIYDKNSIDELGNAYDLGIYFYNEKKNIYFSINYTYINEKNIYYEVIYDNKNMSKIFNFVNFMVNIRDKIEYFD